jgi:hypothetical protein
LLTDRKIARRIEKDLVTMSDDDQLLWKSVRDLIEQHEGRSYLAYSEQGRARVGVGFNLDSVDAIRQLREVGADYDEIICMVRGLSDEQIDGLFDQQLTEAIIRSRILVEDFDELTQVEQAGVVHFTFCLIPAELEALRDAASNEDVGGWATTEEELGNSRWYEESSPEI